MKLLRIILVFACAVIATGTYAQDCDEYTVSAQNGNAYYTPVNNFYRYSFTQQIFTPGEVGSTGNITNIAFKYCYTSPSTKKNNVKIYLGHTNKDVFNSTTDWVSPNSLTLVYTGDLNCSTGWNDFELDVPFAYNGVDNLIVCVDDESNQYDGSSYTFYYTNCTDNKTLTYQNDATSWTNSTSNSGTLRSYRPDICFKFCEPYAMSSGTHTLTTCNVTIYDNGGPSGNYAANSNDTLIIYPSTNDCKVSLTGGTYNMANQSSGGIPYDYIKIFNGDDVSGTLLSTLSGLNGTITTPITSTASNGALTIVFHSNGSNQKDGFALSFSCDCPITSYNMSSGTHTITACDITVYDNGGPNGDYANNSNDILIINPTSSGCFVSLTGTYYTEASYDTIKIYNGAGVSGALLATLAGNGTVTTPITSTASNGALTISFHSDGSVQYDGFEFFIDCSGGCSCGIGPSGLNATTGDQQITLTWNAAAGASGYLIEYGPHGFTPGTGTQVSTNNTSYTFNNLVNGAELDFYVSMICNGTPITPVMISATPNITYNMTSGTHTITSCGTIVYDNGGPNGDYSTYSNDTLIIYPSSSGCMVSLTGTYLTESVSLDYIKVFNGAGTSGTLLATFGGTGAVTTPIYSSAPNGALTIVFHSDGSVQKSGYEFFIDCSGGCSCGIGPSGLNATTGNQQIILSWTAATDANGYVIEYGPHGFAPGTGTQVSTNSTSYTFNNLTNGLELDFYVSMICNGTPAVPVMVSSTPNNDISMQSGSTTITACNTIVYDNGGANGDYANSSNDTLIIYPATTGCKISLTGSYVTESATLDYIKIFDGAGVTGTLLATLGGTGSVTTPINSTDANGALTIVFRSDGSVQKSGFEFVISTICQGNCNCDFSPQTIYLADTVYCCVPYHDNGLDTTFTHAGTYKFSFVNIPNNNCDTIRNVLLTLTVLPVSISGSSYFCADSSVTLTASPGVSYLWNTGETSQSITVNQIGTYRVTVTAEQGCTASASHIVAPIDEFISSISIPDMCAGNSYLITGSYETESEIELYHTQSTLSIADTAFLPDGVPCDPYGCSYRSTLTFTDYNDTSIVESVDDIYYVKINLEHSFIGDIYINITCPNGQKADIMRWSGSGSTDCSSLIPESSREWQDGDNYSSAHFGDAYDFEDSDNKCDMTSANNAPGTGWNYCWSNNNSQGYTYAADGGLVYRSANVHNGSVDSSNVEAGTQFYHPDESFESLIGCPLNGNWYIEVMDGWGIDNGYIFGWELSLTEEQFLSNPFDVSYITPDSIWTTVISDTSFTISPPADLSGDTTILYTLHFYDSDGCSFDTIVPVQVYAAPHSDIWVTTCDEYEWNGVTLTTSGEYTQTFPSTANCDSVVTLHLTINDVATGIDTQTACNEYIWIDGNTYTASNNTATYTIVGGSVLGCDSVVSLNLTINDAYEVNDERTVCPNALPYVWNDVTFTEAGTQSVTLTATNGCDSVVNMTLSLNDAYEINDERTVCPTALPYEWNGVTFNEAGTQSVTLTAVNGCDSVVNMTLSLNDAYEINDERTVCPTALPYEWNGVTFNEAGTQSVTLTATNGCDSVVNMTLSLNDAYEINDERTVCPNALPYSWNGVTFNEAGTQSVTLTAVNGCDSVVNMTLSLNSAYEVNDEITVCPNALPYEWNNVTFTEAGTQSVTLTATNGCDSVVNMTLSLNDAYEINDERTVCPTALPYEWNGVTFHEAGTQSVTLTATNGCDSVVNMILSLNSAYEINDERTVCPTALPYVWNGLTFNEAGTQSVTLTADNGCDSVVNMTLSLNDAYEVNDEITVCPTALPYSWNGVTFNEAGTQSVTLTAVNGCDSVVNMTLSLNSAYEVNDEITVCPNALPYEWNNVTFTEAGTQSVTLTATNGCDSVVNMTLSLNDAYEINDERTVCPTALPYSWNGVTFNEAGTQSVTLTAVNGCDSVVNMTLSLNDAYEINDERTVCPTALPYVWNGVTFNEAGMQSVTLTAVNGCDSVVNMTLSLNDAYEINDEITVCPTALPYVWNGVTFNEAGTQSVTLTADNGCDSVVNMTLSLNDAYEINDERTVCPTALPYSWNGVSFTEAGTQSVTLTATNGCDSVVNMTLSLNDAYEINDERTVCPTALPYVWNGVTFTEAGTQSVTITAANGCDSVVNMTLSLNDAYEINDERTVCPTALPYSWNGVTFNEAGTQSVTLTAVNGCDSVVNMTLLVFTPTHTATSQEQCGGTFIWNGTEYAESGDYTFSHEDGNGCIQVDTLHLVIHPLPETPILSVTDNTSCTEPNGSISIIAPTGDGLTYSLNGGTPQSENSFSGLTTGTFTITVWNNNGCSSSASDSVSTIGSTVNVAASANSPCVNGTLELSASSESSDVSFEWTGPNNFSSSESQHIISNVSTDHAGVYTVVVTEIATGCTASASTTVSIHTPTTGDTTATACYSFFWHGETFTVSGDYRDTLANINGCDSVVTLHLTINDTVFHQFEAQSCYSYDWNNTAYTQSGDYVQYFTAQNGCDSIVTLHLTINDTVFHQFEAQSCYSYDWNNTTYTQSGDYIQYFTAQNGCDSIVTLHLTINDTVFHQFEAQSCYSYDWNNTAYTQSGDYVQYFTAQNGCDSIVTLHLTINDTVFHQFDAQSCYSYEWNNTTYSLSGDYVQYFTAQNGCDSVVTLHLTISDTVFHQFEAQSCYSYDWNNTTYTQSGDYVQSFTAQNGCDSIVTLHLTISDTVFHQFEAQSCYSYEWNNTIYTQSGDYVQYFTAQNGCDSVVTLHLTISDTVFHQFDAQSCYSYEWNNTIYTLSGDYVQYFTAANGCDSVVTLHLTINTPTHTATSQEQCGGTFTWNGTEYAESGDYTFSHEDDNGCIQVDTLHLIIHPLPETLVLTATDNTSCADPNGAITIESPIGSGFSYSINGTDFQTQTAFNGLNTGDFTVTVMDEYGCTSTATVNVGTVGNTVTAAASANTPCAGGVLELYAETETTGATFAWSGPNNYSSNEQNPALEYASPNLNGEYALTVTDPVTHCSMSANVYVNVISPNVGNISINGVTILCDGESTDLTAFAFGNNGDVSFTWSNGDIGATVTMTPTESTTYTVTATATIDDCSASVESSVEVTVNALPQVNISGEFSFCQGESTTLIATEGYTYLWDNNLPSQSISVSEGGTYTVTVTDDNNCSNSASVTVNMLALPAIPSLTPTDNTSCADPNGAITVDSPVGLGFTYSINGADFQTETVFTDLHPGDYIITVMDENGCVNNASVNVGAVGNTVDAVASANTPCAGEPLVLTAETGTSAAIFDWTGPNGYSSNEQNPTRDNANDNMSGQYTLTVTNPETHCSAASNVIVTVNSPNTGIVNIYGVTTLCLGDSTELIVTPTGGNGEFSYVWNTGDTTTNISLNPVESATYTVSTTAVVGDCSASTETSVNVIVNPLPDANISGITAFCEDDVQKLTAAEGIAYHWSNNSTTQSIYVFESGTYSVTVTDINNCSNSDSVSVELLPLPSTPTLTPTDNSSCTVPNGAITVDSPIGAGFTYSIDDIDYQAETTFNGLDAGNYIVIVFNEYGCASAGSVSVGQIGNMVDATASANTPCAGETLVLAAETNTSAATFSWAGPDSFSSNEQNPIRENANEEMNGQYILTVTDSVTHCSMTDTVLVSVISPNTGTITIIGDTVLCQGDSTELSITVSDNNGNLSYLWDTGETTTTVSANPSQSTTYTVTTTATLDGCSTSAETSVNVIVNTLPDISISGTLIFCDGEVQELTASNGYNYLWGDNSTSQSILVSEGGEYAVTATDSNGCSNSTSVNVTVNPIIYVTIDTTICHEASYPFDNQSITTSGTYIDTLTSSYGCDSIVTLNLIVADELRDSLLVDICLGDSYFHPYFGELSPTETHTYQTVVTLDQGCSQTFSLTLTVHQPKETHIETSLCVGDTYQDNGFNIIATHATDTTYILNDTTTFGCDSTIFLHLIVHPSTDTTFLVTIVQNDLPFELNSTYYYTTGIYTQDTLNIFGCDSIITLNLIVNENVSNEIDSTICDNALPMTWNSVEFLTAGDTTITLTAATGADSVLTMHLHVNPTYHIDIFDTVCAGVYFESHGFQTTSFSDTILSHNDLSVAGCDSVTTLHLTVKQPTAFTDVHDTCDSFTWIDGVTYTESTTEPTVTLVNAAGCDSVITLHLTIRKSTDYTDVHDTCDSFTWIDGITYTESTNTPTVTLVNAAGCDSVVTLNLTIRRSTTFTDVFDTCCNSFTWIDGITYTESTNSPTFTLTNTVGCDSVVSLQLTIRKPTIYTDTHDTCDNFTWINGITYTESTNTPTVTLTNAAGCDSVVTLNLTIYHPIHSAVTETTCESFTWNNQTYLQSGTYTFAHPDENSCTQVDTLHLTVNYPVHTSITETACESYLWNGQTYTSSGTYTFSHEDANGCTQVDTLHLTVNYPTHTAMADTACESYTWNNQTYTQSGTYTFSHNDANGCTQVDTLHLIVHHQIHIATTENACESFEWNGTTYTESGTYLFTHLDAHGCTQVDTLHLTIHLPVHTAISQFTCDNYLWNDKIYSASGTYLFSHLDENGCEQVDTLHLTFVDPATSITSLTNHFCSEGRLVLEVQTQLEDYVWSTGETSQTIIVNEEGTYTVTASQGDCEAVAAFTIEPCELEILLPNAIHPDGNGLNEFFSIAEAYYDQINDFGFSIYIYNRWGVLVFSSTSKYFQWNGEVNGTIYHDNVYNYIIEYRTKSGSPRNLKGSITVL